ncbi:dystonin isoform X15 [Bombus vosnesenskii]|uniref:Dystonin isoform X15 n=1 Tax=Bombus vosnesenskii TaxID=207650 RepID=A0A6J3L001_9HYME|nr:dystonin isoform X15 [Bombus vosnesenskii]
MSTQAYYKERLGFDPADTVAEHHREQRSQHGYEESLSKFKGQNENGFSWMMEGRENWRVEGATEHRSGSTQAFWGCWAMFIEAHDERDAIQKKTFTKWVNKHLKKHWKYVKTYTCLHVCVLVNNQPCCSPTASRHVGDLFEDLRDGHNLISLLEVLSGEHLPRERGRMRFHMLQNVQMALDFLRYKKIKLVNIRAEDIVDGNPKLTLGLIWTIILHFQSWRRKISDIVVGQESNVTAREALLRWARRSTARYPGVRVTDFTGSWRDGLAFSALIHRNRPDLVDWKGARASQPRERLDRVFYVAEREYGVTRLLDPEDVDTPEPDEKSLITYISSLYDVFPEPPTIHPLYDAEDQRRSEEYRELASSLHMWIREKMCLMQERVFPPTLIEMKNLAAGSTKFKNEEVPPRYRDKQRLSYIFRDLQKYFEAVGEVDIEPHLRIEVIEENWNRLMMLHQEREQAIIDEIKRLERLQRLAEKVHREMKATDNRLEELERRVEDEARRLDRLHPLEAKHAVDLLEQDIRNTEVQIQNIFPDVHTLTEGRYSQAAELRKRVQKLHQRWVALRSLLHKRLVQPLSAVSFPVEERVVTKHRTTVHETRLVDTNPHFRALHDCIDWCKAKIKQLQDADYGSDLPSVQNELEVHQREHKNIEQFHPKVERCVQAKSHFHAEELTLYSQHLTVLQKLHTELLAASNKRLSDLDTLHDFIQSATNELVWLSSKEETEVTRDWSDKNLNVQSIEQYYERTFGSGIESLMSDLEKREIQFSAVQDRGEALVLQHHPAAKTIEAYMSAMQSQWTWLLQLTLCLEVHLKHAAQSQQFFRDVQQAEQWISKRDESLNTIYSQSEFSLDEGERLLKGMQELREELNSYGDHVQKLVDQAKDVVPMKQRRQPVARPMQVTCVCSYKQVNMSIEKGEQCTLYDNSGRIKWRVKNQEGVESPVPGVCFALQPPDKDALDAAERLRRQYDRSVGLWQRKQLRLRQNMIFATIKVVKGWDLPQFLAMGQDQRTAIRKALNEDAEKLLSEGDPADPQLRRLKRETAEVNKLFDELEKRARAEEESKNAGRIFNEQISAIQEALDEAERVLNTRIAAPLPRDIDSLEHLVLQHKDFEQTLKRQTPDLDKVQQTFRGITLKTPAMRNKLDAVTTKWTNIWNSSNLYIERLKCVEIVLSSLEENTTSVSELEVKLASFDELPPDLKGLQNVLEDLMVLQNAISQQQTAMDKLNEDTQNARHVVEKSRPSHRGSHSDMDRLDDEVNKLNSRWTNLCAQLVERVRSAEAAYGLAQQLEHAYRNEVDFIDESYEKLEVENAKNLLNKVVERAPAIEAVNVTGSRLIREGKIYGQRLRAFTEQLEDICPSLDASVKKPRREFVSTVDDVARDLDTLNKRYTTLVDLLQERVTQLAAQQTEETSQQFQEALEGLQKWLTDTEEMVSNQKSPSSDYNVVKAQLQEQKFLKKMLMDQQNSMSSSYNMGQEVAAEAEPKERKKIEKQLKDLMARFDNLTESAAKRMEALEQAMGVAKQFQDKLIPLQTWLDKTEKRVRDMELVPTDEEKIQQRVTEHDGLHEDILSKKPEFSELTEVASQLMSLVGEDEAAALADKLQDAADRYAALVERSESLGNLLQRSRQGLRHLVLSYQELQAWMEGMEIRLSKYRVLAVHTEKLLQQMEDLADLTEEVSTRQTEVDSTTDTGLELMKHISSDEALQLKDKLDSLQRRFNDLVSRGSDLLKHAQESLPLVQQFHDNHNRLMDWMQAAESALQSAEPREDEIIRLEMEISEYRPVLDKINAVGPQLSQLSPGEGAATIEALVTRDNRRFAAIAEQIQRKAERLQLSKQRSLEVIGDIDDLLEWFHEVDNQLREAEPPSSEPEIIRVQLKEHKALNDDISSQKGRVRDVISTAKKVIRENGQYEDKSTIRENMEDLRETMEIVSGLSMDRLGALEQALPLAEHLRDTHIDLVSWLEEAEQQVAMLPMPALRPDLIAAQQDKNEFLVQSINEHKPLVEKLNKTGEALLKLCNEEEGIKIQDILEADTTRYAALRAELRGRQQTLEQALQESSQFSDKLEGMLRALSSTADQVNGAEPISAHPGRLRDQMEENSALVDELAQRSEAYAAVRRAADDVISKAGNRADPAVKDIKRKLDKLNKLWSDVQKSTTDRGQTLDEALAIAEKFWSELNGVMSTLRELQDALAGQAPPAAQPAAIQQQQVALQEIRHEIDQTKPDVEQVRASGHELMGLCGEPDKPDVRKHIEDLDQAWDNVTALYARREENLIDAMEKAMEFHETLQNLLEFLQEAEDKFSSMGLLGSDIDEVKKQIKQLANFKAEVDPHMVKVEALNRQAAELTERTSSEQAAAIKEPLGAVNRRWDGLLRGLVERQRLLENALLRLGQFQHALDELLVWIEKTDDTLDNLKAVAGDPQVIEVELAKLKVLVNDIQAHQTSVDTLNDAGRQLIEDGKGTAEASTTAEKLGTLNRRWRDLLQRAADRQRELEDALREAQTFTAEIQDLLSWLGDVDNTIVASKPVGGLPETASEQLERFMEVYNELEQNRLKVESVLQQGQAYLKRADSTSAGGLNHNLRTLKQRWDNVTARASDKKIKLEIALKEATEFHDALQSFVDWLTNAEKILTNLKPVSRVMETILGQIEEHKAFQKDVGVHRETMLNLDKKGTHLKYFSQKQDVILIKNLLISVQHRWERVVSKSAERTRALDHGYKEAREFHDAWSNIMNWLDETEKTLDEVASDGALGGNDPEKIKARLNKHRELQKALSAKQGTYDATMKNGKSLKDKAPKSDEFALKELLNELKNKWTTVCGKCVDRQRKLEEALLFSGQFKDAIQALLEWLSKSEKQLADTGPLYGDLDTVMNLVEQHKTFEKDLESRVSQMESVIKTGRELLAKATPDDASAIGSQLAEINNLWDTVTKLSSDKTDRLQEALREAERLHKAVHVLLEWLSDAEMKLRFAGQLPEDEQESRNQLMEHEKFLRELSTKEIEKDQTLELAHVILAKAHPDGALVIKHWITIIQSRWEEVSTWAQQRNQRLENHMRGLQDLDNLLEELLSWLEGLENTLNALEAEPLPDDKATLEMLIVDHREFMENTSRRQNEVDRVCKARQIKSAKDTMKITKAKSPAPTRASPGRERTPDSLPHIGPRFPPKGSKGAEPEFRSPRVKLLWDRWRHVWMLAWERQRRLQDKYNYIQELDRVANFSWEDWRKRFLKFMNHKKSRLTDLFRKMDKNNDGLIPREDFIQGIMNTKFETSRLEMGAVADLFDRHGEGLIDWKEFIAALRPDWEERRTYNDTDKIHDEVKRLVMLCTCRQKFRVFQVGEGKYRFGDSQKLRLVRILRSTVMVRVGGGWVALDEFLLKNDPCRAEEFMNQLTPIFESLRQKEDLPCSYPLHMHAPSYHWVRERSARSVPMGQSRASRSSLSAGTPDSLSDNESSFKLGSARKTSTPYRSSMTPGGSRPSSRPASRPTSRPTSRPGSRPASRQGSKPPSRYGSTQSLDSTDDSTNVSRIPRRTAVSTTGNTPTSSRHNSVSGKRLSVNGSSSRPRTPTGLVSPASGVPARFGTIHRASSIPTLTGVGTPISRSRIPVYVGTDIKSPQSTTSNISTHSTQSNYSTVSTDSTGSSSMCTNSATNTSSAVKRARTRTPSSGSSTPLPPSLKLSRKPSGASDTSVSTTPATKRKGKPTPIDQRAPFRL